MGTRYHIMFDCPECGETNEAYYAPTCGFTQHRCERCGHRFDLGAMFGVSSDDARNKNVLRDADDANGTERL